MKNGFTIIEVLIAITISGVIALILTQLLSQTLQGGNKSDLLNNIQQNGQSALSRIEADVHSSTQIICANSTVLVLAGNSGDPRYWFVAPSGGNNGYIEEDLLTDISTTDIIQGYPCITDRTNANYIAGVTGSQQDVTNKDVNSGVSVLSTSGFDANAASHGLIGVNLYIGAPVNAQAAFTSQVPSGGVPFQTSIKVRCYNGEANCE